MKKSIKKETVELTADQPEKKVEQPQEEKVEQPIDESKENIKEDDFSYVTFDKMNEHQMQYHLHELSTTVYWQAILKYIYKRDSELLSTVAGLDPFSQPTIMSRAQGERIGIYNLKNLIDSLIQINKDAVKTKEQKAKEENNTPSYRF